MKNFYFPLLFYLIFSFSFLNGQSLINRNLNSYQKYLNAKDTLYTLSDHIIEVYLPEQKIFLHFRNGKTLEFKCSTGDSRLEKGVETPEGIFVIKNKARKVYSAQFDSTLMLNWMGFNFNIGFHALEGKSYIIDIWVKEFRVMVASESAEKTANIYIATLRLERQFLFILERVRELYHSQIKMKIINYTKAKN